MTGNHSSRRILISLAVLAQGCGEDLKLPPAGNGPADGGHGGSHVATMVGADATSVRVDATRADAWVYFSFGTGQVHPAAPEASGEWDIAFQRFKVKSNGGISGSSGVVVAPVAGISFEALTQAPSTGWLVDQTDGPDDNMDPDYAFNAGDGWFAYNFTDHRLTPRPLVYVLRSAQGSFYRVQLTGYYDAAGNPGWVAFRWAPVAAPAIPPAAPDASAPATSGDGGAPVDGGTDASSSPDASAAADTQAAPVGWMVEAASATEWVFLDLGQQRKLAITDPSASRDWDVAVSRTRWRTNSGVSGPGLAGARLAPSDGDVSGATTVGYEADVEVPNPGPPGSGSAPGNPVLSTWYDYDPATHAVSPKRVTYLVRTASGGYARLQVRRFDGGVYTLDVASLPRRLVVQNSVIAAADATAWTHFSFRAGAVVAMPESGSRAWDLGLSRTRLRTNGGVSGSGLGAALATSVTEIEALTMAPTDGWVVDTMVPTPGPPGSGEYAGNAVLAGWYDYDPATHATTPGNRVYLIRTADGGLVKMKVRAYQTGTFTIDWVYAGAGQAGF